MNEREAIRRLQRGDIDGLEPLVRTYHLAAVRTAMLVLHDRELAEDVAQASFIRAFERIHQFDDTRPFGPWFLRGVANAARQAARTTRRQATLGGNSEVEADLSARLIDPELGPEDLLERAETMGEVRALLERLTPAQRAAIVQRYLFDQSELAVAQVLAIPVGTVKWRLSVARRRLRDFLRVSAAQEHPASVSKQGEGQR